MAIHESHDLTHSTPDSPRIKISSYEYNGSSRYPCLLYSLPFLFALFTVPSFTLYRSFCTLYRSLFYFLPFIFVLFTVTICILCLYLFYSLPFLIVLFYSCLFYFYRSFLYHLLFVFYSLPFVFALFTITTFTLYRSFWESLPLPLLLFIVSLFTLYRYLLYSLPFLFVLFYSCLFYSLPFVFALFSVIFSQFTVTSFTFCHSFLLCYQYTETLWVDYSQFAPVRVVFILPRACENSRTYFLIMDSNYSRFLFLIISMFPSCSCAP